MRSNNCFIKAYHEEMNCWRWSSLGNGAEGFARIFAVGLWLRISGSSIEELMDKIREPQSSDYEI